MTLNKQNITVPLRVLDESIDSKMLPDGSFTVVENARFSKEGKIEKRYGYSAITQSIDTGGSTDSGSNLLTVKDEVLLFDGIDILSYRPTSNTWNLRNRMSPCSVSATSVFGNDTDKIILDSCSINNAECVLYTSKTYTGLWAALLDPDTQAIANVVELTLTNYTIDAARCTPTSPTGDFAIVYSANTSGSVTYTRINYTGSTVVSPITLAGSFDTTKKQLEIMILSNAIALVVWATAADIYAEIFNVSVPASPTYSGNLGISTDVAFALKKHYSSTDWYIGVHTGTSITCYTYDNTLSLQATSNTITASDEPTRMTAAWENFNDTYKLIFFWDSRDNEVAANGESDLVYKLELNEAGTTINSIAAFVYNAWIVGEAISIAENGDTHTYIPLGIKDETQSFYGLFKKVEVDNVTNLNPLLVSKFLIGTAAEDENQWFVPGWINESNNVLACLKRVIDKEVDVSDLYQNREILRVVFDFSPNVSTAKFGNSSYISAGPLKIYDGLGVRFAEYNTYPVVENTTITNSGGNIENGTYQYQAIYETLDSYGQIIRSAPSVAISVVVDKAANASSVTLRFKTPSFHDYDNQQKENDSYFNTRLKLYRTTAGGSIFYLVNVDNDIGAIDPGRTNDVVVDTLADANITDEETIYTTGGELANISIPSISELVVHKNRLFVAGADEPKRIYYSKTKILGEAAGFYTNLRLTYEVDVKALASVSDKLIVFGENQIDHIAGDGPNNLGANNTFRDFFGLSDEIGCINSKSVITTDVGVFFLSKRGMYLLNKSLALSYVGKQVEDTLNSNNILRGVNLPKYSEARWLLDDETIIVYNYKFNQWAIHKTFTNAVDIASTQDKFYILLSTGEVLKENTTLFTDDGTAYSLKFTTGWISLTQYNNLKRLYKIAVLGSYQGGHNLNIELSYNYDDTVVDTLTWDPTQLDSDESYQLNINPSRQKVFAIKATLYDDSWLAGSKEAWSFSALGLTLGMKGPNRQFKSDKSV